VYYAEDVICGFIIKVLGEEIYTNCTTAWGSGESKFPMIQRLRLLFVQLELNKRRSRGLLNATLFHEKQVNGW
jgi:hypothetical protein